jgi:transmembrane sensor
MTDEPRMNRTIRLEAANWVVRLDADDVSTQERQALEAWLAADAAHRQAFERAQAGWDELSALTPYALRSTNALSSVAAPANAPWLRVGGAVAAALAIAVLGVGLLRTLGPAPVAATPFESAVGEQNRVPLPDGSFMLLNTASRAEIRFDEQTRVVALLAGEAFFEVAKDPERPFRVDTAGGSVTAVGTAFAVSVWDGAVQVAVTEGTVSVRALAAASSSASAPPVELAVGESVRIAAEAVVLDTQPLVALERQLSWRTGILEFEDEPLGAVVQSVSRYTDLRIDIHPSLEDRRFGGAFPVGDVEALLGALPVYGVKVERLGPDHVRLSAEPT